MRNIRLISLLVIVLLIVAGSAMADTLHFVGVNGSNAGGYYTAPYNFTVNDDPTVVGLMCLNFNKDSYIGTSWDVTKEALPLTANYEAAALLFLTPNKYGDQNTAQYAAWNLFDSTDNPVFGNSQSVKLAALADVGNHSDSFYSQFYLYTPTNTENQTFLGYNPTPTPEPASLVMLGSGLLGLGGMIRRRLIR